MGETVDTGLILIVAGLLIAQVVGIFALFGILSAITDVRRMPRDRLGY